ncbi:GntR family transcriptional regulator [Collinsella tanakaei]|uniref:GntR family transcriptional regulator n=1 Tax=Collinsella tanakaei TaxID=626935 RepID=UPI001F3DD6A5|nr:GntR family transcriptional regulator [Collinsella tanakaei]
MPKAVFQDIYRDLKSRIERGAYAYQSFLPSEAELTAHYGCSRSSVRRAIRMLAEDGYVQSQQGKGVRVIRDPHMEEPAATTDSRPSPRSPVVAASPLAPNAPSASRSRRTTS